MPHTFEWATRSRIADILKRGSGRQPYPHQVDGVNNVLRGIEQNIAHRFLLYYAPRTGKTYVQACLAYIFMQLAPQAQTSLVVVVNDREALDSQSYDVVLQFVHNVGLPPNATIARADSAADLRFWLDIHNQSARRGEDKRFVLFTTLQKFATQAVEDFLPTIEAASRTVVIPDEVHRSHKEWGTLSQSLERVLGHNFIPGGLLYIAMTGTPSSAAMDRFGMRDADGVKKPFHSYHLGTAVSEQVVMDPRTEYVEVASLVAGIDLTSMSFQEKTRLQRLLACSPQYLRERIEFLLDHFERKSQGLSYKAQGMIVCNDRLEVVRATRAARQIARRKASAQIHCDNILGAFSGRLDVDGQVVNETALNGFALKSSTDAKKAQLLFVAHKFETGYDNPNLTFMYLFRHLQGTSATQVALRHCGKRVGKVRPVTCDFASQGGSALDALAMYFGDVIYKHGAVMRREPARAQDEANGRSVRQQSQGASRRDVEQQLMQWLRLDHLEARPVATPLRSRSADAFELRPCRAPPPPAGSAVEPQRSATTDTATDVLLLKCCRGPMGQVEENALDRIALKANTGHSGTLQALSRHGVSTAMQQVLIFGARDSQAKATGTLEKLQEIDTLAKALVEVNNNIGLAMNCSTHGAQVSFEALTQLDLQLRGQPELALVAARLNAEEGAVHHLTEFDSSALMFGLGFGTFMAPFFQGNQSPFYKIAWGILEALSAHSTIASHAIQLKQHLERLSSMQSPTRDEDGSWKSLQDFARLAPTVVGSAALAKVCLKHLDAVETMKRMLAFGDINDQQVAEQALQIFARIDAQSASLATLRSRLEALGKFCGEGPLPTHLRATLTEVRSVALSSNDPFDMLFSNGNHVSIDLRVMINLGLVDALKGLADTAEGPQALEILRALVGRVRGIDDVLSSLAVRDAHARKRARVD